MTLVAPKKPHKNHRKRTGKHQHAHKHFGKTYWPYLPLALIVGLGFVLNSVWPSHRDVLGYATEMSSSALLSGTNAQRSSHGKSSLTLNTKLSSAAQSKAADMAAKDYWSHNSPDGKTPWSFIKAAGYSYQTAGENLAYGFDSSSDTITGWMNSNEHRANILNSSYTNVGFGIVNIPNYQGDGPETLVVAMYASPASVAATAEKKATPPQSQPTPVNTTTLSQSKPVESGGAALRKEVPAKTKTTANADPTAEQTDIVTASQPDQEQPSKSVSRLQLVANNQASWSVMSASIIVCVAFVLFIVRHGYAWHRLLNRGERFVLKHPVIDVTVVAIITLGFVLSSTVGFIK